MAEDLHLTRSATKNHILAALSEEDYNRLMPHLEMVRLKLNQVIYRPTEPIKYVYFPNDAMISVLASTPAGECAEAGVIGREGIVGIDVFIGGHLPFNESIIQNADRSLRIKSAVICQEFKRGGAFHDLTLRFIRVLMLQISQTALCNRIHTVEERLARWLLMCHDRVEEDKLTLTQEFLSVMLGTNRETVTVSAIALQERGFIKYSRGLIVILEREGLEASACGCYRIVKDAYDKFQNQSKESDLRSNIKQTGMSA